MKARVSLGIAFAVPPCQSPDGIKRRLVISRHYLCRGRGRTKTPGTDVEAFTGQSDAPLTAIAAGQSAACRPEKLEKLPSPLEKCRKIAGFFIALRLP
jgi:hypothetical protein